jgi:hypothetical protein
VRAIAYRRDVLLKTGLSEAQAFTTLAAFEHTLQSIKTTSPDIAPLVRAGRNDWNVWQDAAMAWPTSREPRLCANCLFSTSLHTPIRTLYTELYGSVFDSSPRCVVWRAL